MSKKKENLKNLADPSRLDPVDVEPGLMRVVIETPKGSRNKFALNAEDHVFELKKVLPAGMTFPYDFGFVPSTKAQDGDPLDVLIFMDEPAFPGCVIQCRIVGAIEGKQGATKKDLVRNDRILAVEKGAHSWSHLKSQHDLGKTFVQELEEFFVNYHRHSGQHYHFLGLKGPSHAWKLVKAAMRHR